MIAKNPNVVCVDDEPTVLAYAQGLLGRRSSERENAAPPVSERRRRSQERLIDFAGMPTCQTRAA